MQPNLIALINRLGGLENKGAGTGTENANPFDTESFRDVLKTIQDCLDSAPQAFSGTDSGPGQEPRMTSEPREEYYDSSSRSVQNQTPSSAEKYDPAEHLPEETRASGIQPEQPAKTAEEQNKNETREQAHSAAEKTDDPAAAAKTEETPAEGKTPDTQAAQILEILKQLAALMTQIKETIKDMKDSVPPELKTQLKAEIKQLADQIRQLVEPKAGNSSEIQGALAKFLKNAEALLESADAEAGKTSATAAQINATAQTQADAPQTENQNRTDSAELSAETKNSAQLSAEAQNRTESAQPSAATQPGAENPAKPTAAAAKPAGQEPVKVQADAEAPVQGGQNAAPGAQAGQEIRAETEQPSAPASKTQQAAETAAAPKTNPAQNAAASAAASEQGAAAASAAALIEQLQNLLQQAQSALGQGQTQNTAAAKTVTAEAKAVQTASNGSNTLPEALKIALMQLAGAAPEEAAGQDKKGAAATVVNHIRSQFEQLHDTIGRLMQGQPETGAKKDGASSGSQQGNPAFGLTQASEGREMIAQALKGPTGTTQTEQNVMQQIVQSVRLLAESGKMEAQIQIDPPQLGKVNVTLSVDGDRINARLVVENESTKQLIERNIDQLKQTLASQGYDVDGCEVSLGKNPQNNPGRQSQGQTGEFAPFDLDALNAALEETPEPAATAGAVYTPGSGHVNVLI